MSLCPWGSASSSLTGLSHGICWATSFSTCLCTKSFPPTRFSTSYVQRACHQPSCFLCNCRASLILLCYKQLLCGSATRGQQPPAPKIAWCGPKLLPRPLCSFGGTGEAEVRHDKTCLPGLPKVSLFCFLVCGTLTRSGRSIWQWVTNSRPPCESAAQPGRAQECWLPGLAVITRSCFPCGCPSKALMGEYSAEISPVMRISHCNSWQSWIAADLWASVQIFSNSSFETPLPPSVLPFASISHFYLMGCFCVCFVSCKLW